MKNLDETKTIIRWETTRNIAGETLKIDQIKYI